VDLQRRVLDEATRAAREREMTKLNHGESG
jgi:hypothetical protein